MLRSGEQNAFERMRRSRRRKRFLRRTGAAAVLLVVLAASTVLAAVVYQLDLRSQLENYRASLRRGDGFPVPLDGMTILDLLPMGRDVAVLTSAGAYIYNSSGALINSCLNDYRTPVAKTAGGKLLTYDLGGSGLRVDNKAKALFEYEVEGGSILDADIAPTGAVAVAQSSPGVNARVSAYNPRFELMYVWTVQDSYITGVSLSRQGDKMACAGLVMEDQHIVSLLRIHHFDQDEEAARVPLTGEIIVSMVWTDQDRIQVVTDKSLYLYDREGTRLAEVRLPGALLTYENLPGAVYAAYGDYRDPAGVTILAWSGELEPLGTARVDRKLLSLTADGSHLLVLTEGQLYLADPALRELKRREHRDLYRVCPAGSDLYGIAPDGLIRSGL